MTISQYCSAGTIVYCAIWTAVNLATGGEPSPLMALIAVLGLVQYVVVE